MLSRFSIASDYATCSGGGTEFYFGYERTVGDEWAFTATVDGKEVMRIPQSKLGVRSASDMGEFLLAGISLWLQARQTHSEHPALG